jgi:hypothetical protein
VALGSSRAIATRFRCAPPVTPDSTGLASLPFGPRSALILSMWLLRLWTVSSDIAAEERTVFRVRQQIDLWKAYSQ